MSSSDESSDSDIFIESDHSSDTKRNKSSTSKSGHNASGPSTSKSLTAEQGQNGSSDSESCPSPTLMVQLGQIDAELKQVEAQLQTLRRKKVALQERRSALQDEMMAQKSQKLAHRDWSSTKDFPWSKQLQQQLGEVFGIKEFRPMQLAAMNATLSKQDLLLVMPTGGGKSLCYQLPALVAPGLTLVISPLVSLMEDQVMRLKQLGVAAELMSANTKREESTRIRKAIQSGSESQRPRLLYVAPEKLSKNKSFMSFLQGLHKNKQLARIAIDEVHCCSDWGHDFRPDYTFLGVLRDMFSEVPIMGLTATASNRVVADVQKILSLQGCLVLKAPFNRPNLFYEVRVKSSVQTEWLDEVEGLLKGEFSGQSGIIYALTVKDTEELTTALRQRGIRARQYNAMLEPELRSRAHTKWLAGELQVVVATTAFGLGIDKPDVRFVIHHSMSKSLENYYQESGRAGRDGQPASCILYYRLADYFRLSVLVFSQQTGLAKLTQMLAYCLEPAKCRRELVAKHFADSWQTEACDGMCDHCRWSHGCEERDVTAHCRSLYRLLDHALEQDTRLTANMLLDVWLGKGKASLRLKDVRPPTWTRTRCESLLAHLLTERYLREDFHYTAYSTTSYLRVEPSGPARLEAGQRVVMHVQTAVAKRVASESAHGSERVKKHRSD